MQTKHLCVLIRIWFTVRLGCRETCLNPPVKYFHWPFQGGIFCGSFVIFMSCVCHAFAYVHCCLVVTWRERADLLALVRDVMKKIHPKMKALEWPQHLFHYKVWYLIVLIPDSSCLSYFVLMLWFFYQCWWICKIDSKDTIFSLQVLDFEFSMLPKNP